MPFGKVLLNDQNELPLIAFGTGSALFGQNATDSVERALEAGFDHIDTAAIYGNEKSVGVGLKESGLDRSDFYLTTKYDGGDIQKAMRDSLEKLGVKSVDLYLIHFPKLVTANLEASWTEFEKIKDDGLAKSIGVSNFSLEDMQNLMKIARIAPAVNQIRFHPYNYAEMKPLLDYCAAHDVVVAAYSALTPITRSPGGPVDVPVRAAAVRLGCTPAQVLLLWARAKGVAIVTTTSKRERLDEYLATADLQPLTQTEITAIDAAGALGPPKAYSNALKWGARVLGAGALALGFMHFSQCM